MYPAAFDYRSIASLDEALALLAEHGDAAKVMAGGQSLIPLLKLRFAQPSLVVDIGRVKGMTGVGPHDGWLTIGALTRHVKLERKVGDFATVAVAVQIELEGGKVSKAGIGLTAVGPTNIKATAAEKALVGHEPTDVVIAEAARLAAAAAEPKDNIRGSAEFKKDVVRVYVQRGLKTALARAKEARA